MPDPNYRKFNTINSEKGAIHRKFNYFHTTETEVLEDIDNDFRMLKLWALDDINNDFRMVGTASNYNINNDFRLQGATLSDILNDIRTKSNIIREDIDNDFRMRLETLYNINNDFRMSGWILEDINNDFRMTNSVREDIYNDIRFLTSGLNNINNDFRMKKKSLYDVTNDFRMIASWQIPGDAGFQSLGRTYIKIYIDDVEQTDVNVGSINIEKSKNDSHTANFILARAYDDTKPTMEATVEIKYHIWTLYKGYISNIEPMDDPEQIRINCNNKHWKDNRTKKYFNVGHQPQDNKELYYDTIKTALLTELGWDLSVGNFIPQTINCFAVGNSDCITTLLEESGNFGWFYDENENKKLWEAGKGSIINIKAQELDENMNLYHVISHRFGENIENLVNKYRVQMGEKIIRKLDSTGGSKTYTGYRYKSYQGYATHDWNSNYQVLVRIPNSNSYGINYHPINQEDSYKYIFRVWNLPYLDESLSSWTDRWSPTVEIYKPGWWESMIPLGRITEGFTIDYENGKLIFNEPLYCYKKNSDGEIVSVSNPTVKLKLWKKDYYSFTETPAENPESDISNPLMFFTDKMGDYPITIMESLDLSNLSIQEGGTYIDADGEKEIIPSWDDTAFAEDYANWKLSKTCDKKVKGSIEITLDCCLFYNIDLSKRIMIDGVIEDSLNINSITYNIKDFKVTLDLENGRYYERSVSLQSRGE